MDANVVVLELNDCSHLIELCFYNKLNIFWTDDDRKFAFGGRRQQEGGERRRGLARRAQQEEQRKVRTGQNIFFKILFY